MNYAEYEHQEYVSRIISEAIESMPDHEITVNRLYELTGLSKADIREELYESFGEVIE